MTEAKTPQYGLMPTELKKHFYRDNQNQGQNQSQSQGHGGGDFVSHTLTLDTFLHPPPEVKIVQVGVIPYDIVGRKVYFLLRHTIKAVGAAFGGPIDYRYPEQELVRVFRSTMGKKMPYNVLKALRQPGTEMLVRQAMIKDVPRWYVIFLVRDLYDPELWSLFPSPDQKYPLAIWRNLFPSPNVQYELSYFMPMLKQAQQRFLVARAAEAMRTAAKLIDSTPVKVEQTLLATTMDEKAVESDQDEEPIVVDQVTRVSAEEVVRSITARLTTTLRCQPRKGH